MSELRELGGRAILRGVELSKTHKHTPCPKGHQTFRYSHHGKRRLALANLLFFRKNQKSTFICEIFHFVNISSTKKQPTKILCGPKRDKNKQTKNIVHCNC